MDPGSSGSDGEDSDDTPLSVVAGIRTVCPSRSIPSLSGHSKPHKQPPAPKQVASAAAPAAAPAVARAAASAPPKSAKQASTKPTTKAGAPLKRPHPSGSAQPAAKKATPKPKVGAQPSGSKTSATPLQRPVVKAGSKPKSRSNNSSSESSESDEESLSEESDNETSSEDDERSDEEEDRNPQPVVGVLVSSRAKLALERLRDATKRIDPSAAPIGTSKKLSGALSALEACEVLKNVCDGHKSSLSEANANEVIEGISSVATNLADAAASNQKVEVEIEAFRRVANQIHAVWDTTLPQIEILDAAVNEAHQSAARASRVAAELLGAHITLASSVASSLEGLLDRQ